MKKIKGYAIIQSVRKNKAGIENMTLKETQDVLDKIKWFDSIQMGEDQCGSYSFCKACNKWEEHPCAKAKRRYEKGYIRIATVYRRK